MKQLWRGCWVNSEQIESVEVAHDMEFRWFVLVTTLSGTEYTSGFMTEEEAESLAFNIAA